MNTKDDNIELRSEDFREVLGDIPPWILRWGIYILTAFVIIVLLGSSILKYPDSVNAKMKLTGTNPAVGIVAKLSGKLKELRVKDNDIVSVGCYLAVIENPAKTIDILQLKEYLERITVSSESNIILPPKILSLGSIQPLYSLFYTNLCEYNEFVSQKYYPRKLEVLSCRIEKYKKYGENIRKQKSIVEEELIISNNQYLRDSILSLRKVLSKEDLENSKKRFLQSRLSMESMNATIENTEIQIVQMRENLLDIDNEFREKRNSLINQLKTCMNQLDTEIKIWEMNYVFVASIAGKITFTGYWVENQNVISGDVIFNIVPIEPVMMLGKAMLPMARSGKVKIGQKVNIHFDSFPDHEFGIVHGVVQNISLIPVKDNNEENCYIVEIGLPNGLKTAYNKELPYMPEIEGKAAIITEDLSLLERFIFPIRKILMEAL